MKKYPKVLQMHHLKNFCSEDWTKVKWHVQEKLDGSQFRCEVNDDGTLNIGSKNVTIVERNLEVENPDMFYEGVAYLLSIKRILSKYKGYTFFFEYMRSSRQNAIKYYNMPKNHLMLYDIVKPDESFVLPEELPKYAEDLNIDCARLIEVKDFSIDALNEIINNTESFLGGAKIEGVVLKSYELLRIQEPHFGRPIFAKWVREEFKELNSKHKKSSNKDIMMLLIEKYRSEARFDKAIQHLAEEGKLEYELKDLKELMPEIIRDLMDEEEDSIKEFIWNHFKKKFNRAIVNGFPEYYKEYLAKRDV